jgi:signal transduction histidine kinase
MKSRLLFVFMVVVGYIVTFAFVSIDALRGVTLEDIFLSVVLGVVYLLLGLYPRVIYDRVPGGWADVLFFMVQCSLVLGIGWTLGVGGNVLVGLPLVGFAAERLRPKWRWPVYIALVAAVVLPLGLRFETWLTTLINGVTMSILIVFVDIFVQMRQNERRAREHAETLMVELEEANTQLAAYATQAEELAMTQERNRLAREIHDNLGHYLTVVNVQIEAAKVVMDADPARALDAMSKAQELTQKGLARVRESVAALRESPVSNRPLSEAIASLVQEARSSGIVTEFLVGGEPVALEHKVALALYRVAQEGLTNVQKHSRASRVDILLDYQPSEVRLRVQDNGVGAAQVASGFGLLGIRERMQLLGGKLEIDTGLGKGFCLTANLPLSPADRPTQPED